MAMNSILPGGAMPNMSEDFLQDIPGGHIITEALESFGIDVNVLFKIGFAFTILASLLGFLSNAWEGAVKVGKFLSDNLVSSATLRSSDETYVYVMKYMYREGICTDSRVFSVSSRENMNSQTYRIYYQEDMACDTDTNMDGTEKGEDALGPTLKYTPSDGYYFFFFEGRLIIFHREMKNQYNLYEYPEEFIRLYTIGRSPVLLRRLLEKSREVYLKEQEKYIMVYCNEPSYHPKWSMGQARRSRKLTSVVMKSDERNALLQDIKEYIKPSTKSWYSRKGLPYRRGYLFYGKPGTGKTSLCVALASALKLRLYILSLGTQRLTDDDVISLFASLPKKCIVLLEDIDTCGVRDSNLIEEEEDEDDDKKKKKKKKDKTKEEMVELAKEQSEKEANPESESTEKDENKPADESNSNEEANKPKKKRKKTSAVTLSGLLNAIDGVSSQEGRVLIMTTNHREVLDPALIRPGRVDREVFFNLADREILTHIFLNIYTDIADEGEEMSEEVGRADEKEEARIRAMAGEFAGAIPEGRFTPAEVQGYLLRHKYDAREAMEGLSGWLKSKEIEREEEERREESESEDEEDEGSEGSGSDNDSDSD